MSGLRIITCPEWHARPPKQGIQVVGRASEIIVHHTAGHHPEISHAADESLAEAINYAHAIQHLHMDVNGWIDSGHNFLVCRNGDVLQGRWLTVSAIEAGHMVRSAHCPGKNDQIGVEHEHISGEQMTSAQRSASAQLIAWISHHYRIAHPLPLHPHREFFATDCPDNLVAELPRLHSMAQAILNL